MEIREIASSLEKFYLMADSLDKFGMGISRVDEMGEHTTRNIAAFDLFQFYLYLANPIYQINEAQAALGSLIMMDQMVQFSPEQIQELANDRDEFEVENNLGFQVYRQGDLAISKANAEEQTSFTSVYINIFKLIGALFMDLGYNTISKIRYDMVVLDLDLQISQLKREIQDEIISSVSVELSDDLSDDDSTEEDDVEHHSDEYRIGDGKYNDIVSFNLPSEYQMIWKKQEDGTELCHIVYGVHKNEDVDTEWSFSATITEQKMEDMEDDIIPARESPLETIHRRIPDRKYIVLSRKQNVELHMTETPMNLMGDIIKLYVLGILVQTSAHGYVQISRYIIISYPRKFCNKKYTSCDV